MVDIRAERAEYVTMLLSSIIQLNQLHMKC
jgi:hypothetical protein